MRGEHHGTEPSEVLYLYSAKARDHLSFIVDWPDGIYPGLDNSRSVQIKNRRLVWEDVNADESIVIRAGNRAVPARSEP